MVNAKMQRPGVCNAPETLLVHEPTRREFLPACSARSRRGRRAARRRGRARRSTASRRAEANEPTGPTEFLALVLAVQVVGSADEAIAHVDAYGSGHSEAIVTRDSASARAFQLGVDAACVYVNASTRFTDGGEFGMGAEIGNSTQKLHARGPIGAARAVHVQVPGRGRRADPRP